VYVAVLHYYAVMCRCMYLYYNTIQWCVGVCSSTILLYSEMLVYVGVLYYYMVMCWCMCLYYTVIQWCVGVGSSITLL